MSRLASERTRRLRRALWTTSVGLSMGLFGLAVWFLSDVQPTVEAVLATSPVDASGLDAFGVAWRRDAASRVVTVPVEDSRLEDAILRPDLLERDPPHFIFTGPLPGPLRQADPPPPPHVARRFLDLVHISHAMLRGDGRNGLVYLRPRDGSGRGRLYTTGSVIRVRTERDELQWQLEGLRALSDDRFELTLRVPFGQEAGRLDRVIWRRPDAPIGQRALQATSGTQAAEHSTESASPSGPTPLVVPPVRIPRSEPRLVRDPRRPGRVQVELDARTWQRLSGRTVKEWAGELRTRSSRHGLVILDGGDAPLDAFDIERGESIVAIDGRPTRTRTELVVALDAIAPDATEVRVTLASRSGVRRTLVVDPHDPRTKRRARSAIQRGTK